jgi:hypothetical protein
LRGPLARHDRRGDKSTTSRAASRSLIKRVLDRRLNSDQTPSRVVSREARHENLMKMVLREKVVHWMDKSHKIWGDPTTGFVR